MCMRCIDIEKSTAFGNQMIEVLNHAGVALMMSVGHRTGLFDAMSRMDWVTTTEIAQRTGLNERYVREWLGCMVTGGLIEHDRETAAFRLPAEHAAFLTRNATPNNLAASMQWIAVLASAEDRVVEAFTHGRGVPYSAYHRFHEVMAEESGQTVVSALFERILPLVDGLTEKLQQGIRVLDVGCGVGKALMAMAEKYPQSRFTGYDMSSEAVAMAQKEAQRRWLINAHFEVRDCAAADEQIEGAFDLVTAFDAIHDQAKPAEVLANIRKWLGTGGVFLMQDVRARTEIADNHDNPVAPFIYAISCMHCMSVSLASGGPGLGAAWGQEKAIEMLGEAGFAGVTAQTLPHDSINYYYVGRR